MVAAIVIAAISCLGLIVTVIVKPEISLKKFSVPLYPFVALIGACLMLIATPLTLKDSFNGIVGAGAVNPLKILALFISVTAISVFLDEGGFFEYLARKVLKRAGNSQFKLFILLYAAVSVLTVFTSNDIIILTFTPFIICFCKNAGIKAFPYLMAEFVAANTWSMTLIIGNPTNIYIATSAGIDFFTYAKTMAVPAICAGLVALGMLCIVFHKSLKQHFVADIECVPVKDRDMCILGGVMLAVCTVGLAVSNFINVEMWLECVVCLGVLVIVALIICAAKRQKPLIVGRTFARLPYALIPFVLSMFVISLALDKTGVTRVLAQAFSHSELLLYGISSFFASNLVNNIPMSIIFSSMITAGEAGSAAVYASVIGSNLGAILTPIGALAGIMFSSICKKHGERISPLRFIGYGVCLSVFPLAAALGALQLMLML